MNLVQLANDLEYVPKEQLAEMSQDPNSSYPAYLVLSEIQRRTLNEKNYQAMEQQPTTTVAEEVVGEFMQPQLAQNQSQGLQGGTPQSATPLPDSNISAGLSGVPTAPMQMAASGGITGYATGDMTALPAGSAPMMGAGMGMDALGANIDLERLAEIRNQVGDQAFKFMFGEKFGDEFMDYVSVIPAGGLALKGLTKAPGLISSGYKGLKNYFRGPKKNPSGRVTSAEAYGGEGYKYIAPIVENPLTSAVIATPVLGAINQAMGDSEASDVVSDENKKELTAEQLRIQELEKQIKELNDLKGLAGAKETKSRGDYRDLVRLGAGIMSAKNVGDIGTAVTSIVDAQDKRELMGIQGALTQAQTSQILAKTEAMPLQEKLATLKELGNLLKLISSGEIQATDEEKASYALQQQALTNEVLRMQGIASSGSKFLTEAEQKIFNQSKAG